MLLNLLIGIPVMLLCLVMEAIFVTMCLRYYATYYRRFGHTGPGRKSISQDIQLLGTVMVLVMDVIKHNKDRLHLDRTTAAGQGDPPERHGE